MSPVGISSGPIEGLGVLTASAEAGPAPKPEQRLVVIDLHHHDPSRSRVRELLGKDPGLVVLLTEPKPEPSFRTAPASLAMRMVSVASTLLGIPPQRKDYGYQQFGRGGEFTVENVSHPAPRDERGHHVGPARKAWRLEHNGSCGEKLHKSRAAAFEAAADIARARGDSINDCAKLLGGVRW